MNLLRVFATCAPKLDFIFGTKLFFSNNACIKASVIFEVFWIWNASHVASFQICISKMLLSHYYMEHI
jgi:hypothetical protein